MSDPLEGVVWFRGSSVRVRKLGLSVFVDPWSVPDGSEADYVPLTHPHYDNFSEEDVERVRTPDTVVVAPVTMKKQLNDADHLMRPGDLLQLEDIDILAVPAYNTTKKFHTQESGWLGYVFTLAGITFYHAGDTDFIDAIRDIRCDVAFLPCEGHYTMGPEDAARAAQACDAGVVVPIHWGDSQGSREHAEKLAELAGKSVRILERSG